MRRHEPVDNYSRGGQVEFSTLYSKKHVIKQEFELNDSEGPYDEDTYG